MKNSRKTSLWKANFHNSCIFMFWVMSKTLYFANLHALCKVMSRLKTPPRINVTPVRLMLLEISSLWNWYKVEQSLPTGGFFGSLTIHKQDREEINIAGWNGGESEYKEGRDGTKPIHTACNDHISPQWCFKSNIWSGHFFIFIFNNYSQFLCRWFDFSKKIPAKIFF